VILRTAPLPPSSARTTARTTARTNRVLRAALWAGSGCLACGLLAGHHPPRPEKRLHAAANHDTSGWWVLRLPQQLGTPWTLPVLALPGVLTHRPRLAVSAACAVPLEKLLEAGLKKDFARHRPAREDSDTVLHDDAPAEGGPFRPATRR